MASIKRISSLLLAGCAVTTLAACGADDVASPGEGVIVIPAPTPVPTPTPGPSPTPTPTPGQAAAACPTGGFIDRGVIGSRRSCELPTRFTADTTLQNVPGVAYAISGPVNVGTDVGGPGNAAGGQAVTLTIQPGAVLFGSAGSDYLVVNRGSRLNANGTVSQPIIFTARANLEGTVTDSSQGLWGGVILLGRAPISDCNTAVAGGDPNCQQVIEGTTSSLYGGAIANDNSGSLRFVQIRYSGFQIAPGNELQGLTMGGVGSNTTIESVQVHNSSDDGIEIFGGRVNARNLLLTGADDDALDTDLGYQGFIQYVLAIQKPTGDGDSAIEADSNGNEEALPRQNTRVSNATFVYPRVGSGGNVILLRGGTDYTLVNAAVVGAGACIDIDATNNTTTRAADAALQDVGPPVFNSVVLSCPTAFRADGNEAAVSTIFGAGTNNNSAFTSTLSMVYVNGGGETAVPAFNASTINAFFENAGFIGAVRNSSDTRFQGWSCNSGYANFGGTSGNCTAIPTTCRPGGAATPPPRRTTSDRGPEMTTTYSFGAMLLLSSALVAPAALAQSSPPSSAPAGPASSATPADGEQATADVADDPEEEVEISAPGASDEIEEEEEIVVTGRFIPEPIRVTPEVVSVLSQADIARTGEGDIAGALQRVTGLSVVGNGFVFVRGLGDRYSLALLNGSPLPSPEPLRRVVPLDIFPTSVIASAVVQKSYSANYPGEFGGGVINLTTRSIPTESFLNIGVSGSGDSETTGKLGYTYFGSDLDFLGFDDGARDFPTGLRDAVVGGTFNATNAAQRRDFARSLNNAETTLLQRNFDIPANFAADVSAGGSTEVGDDGRLGFIFGAGYSSTWRTRDALQQSSLDPELEGTPQTSFRAVTTDNRVIVNGLLGLGYEFGDQKIRFTNLYIRDTVKQGRLASGFNRNVTDQVVGQPDSLLEQNTYFFERQLIDSQFVGEFKFDDLSIDLRGTYANSQRESPYERSIGYFYRGDGNLATKSISDVDDYVNDLSSAGQFANVAFNDLNENVYAGGIDFAYRLDFSIPLTLSAGYAYTKTDREASRYQFQYFRPDGALPLGVAQERPDFLLSEFNIQTYNIQLRDVSGAEGSPAYEADLEIHAGYGQAEIDVTDNIRLTLGVRYEDAQQTVQTIGSNIAGTNLNNDYFLPAGTVTFNFAENMQLRAHASKTIARPQFRELAPQIYQDFESDREFTGNPFLTDSELFNAEARYEYYFGRGERLTVAGFYKKIDNPIEAAAFFAGGGQFRVGFANAPEATLYGGEVEVQKYFPLENLGGDFFASRRLLLIGNYTYTKSELKVDDQVVFGPDLQPVAANLLFRDGAPLTGQSDHLANVQIGIEDTDKVSQATILLTYASKRVTNRGPIQGLLRQPDIIEEPGFRLDFVAREELDFLGVPVEIKFEARNLTGREFEEFQRFGANRIEINSYDVGTSLSLGAAVKF